MGLAPIALLQYENEVSCFRWALEIRSRDIVQELKEGVGCLGQKAYFESDHWGWIYHTSRLTVVHLNLKLSRLSWSTDRQPISFMSRSISARRFSSALSTPA